MNMPFNSSMNSMERSRNSRRNFGLSGEDKKKVEEMKAAFEPLTRFIKEVFEDKRR